MKKLTICILSILACYGAYADGYYTETEHYETFETFNFETITYSNDSHVAPRNTSGECGQRFASSLDVRPCSKPAAPVHVKTHTEVIDHYQVYQPVTVYQPAGEYTTRRVITTPRKCNRCNG